MNIALKPVESSQIEAIGYDAETQTLAIQFNGGKKVYHYADVPQEVFDGFGNGSAGKHFASAVRGKFTHTIVNHESSTKEIPA